MKKAWIYWLLCAAVLGLVAASVVLHLRGATMKGPDATKGLLSATFSAKMAVLGATAAGSAGAAYDDMVLQGLDQTAREGAPSYRARALRRKAIWCNYRDLGCTEEALSALEAIPAADRAPAPPDEVAVLREILGGVPIAPERVPPLLARLGEIRLGWFDHILRSRLHLHAGDSPGADREMAEAQRTALSSMLAVFAFFAILCAGMLAWLILAFMPAAKRVARELRERLQKRDDLSESDACRLLGVAIVFLGSGFAVGPVARAAGLPPPATPLAGALQTLGAEVVSGLLVIAAHRGIAAATGAKPPLLGFRGSSLKRAAAAGGLVYLLLLPLIFLVLIPLGALFDKLGIPTQSHPIVDQLQASSGNPVALVVWLLVASVAAPLLEEAVFRGALQKALRVKLGGLGAVLLSSLAFAIIHPQVGLGLVAVLVIGLVLALLREHEDSLWPSVVVHALNNGVTLLVAMGLLSG